MNYKEIVWDAFRSINARSGHVFLMRNFRTGVMRQMNPVQQKEFIDELNEMINEELITYEDGETGPEAVRLTEKGFDLLYNNSRSDVGLAEALMDLFRRSNYRVGEIIPMRNINMQFIPSLNPVEQDRFEYVVKKLIDAKFITYEDGKTKAIQGLVLEENGYGYIYSQKPNINDIFA